jgi:hypothetical protein
MLLVDKKLHKAVPHTGGVSEVTGSSKWKLKKKHPQLTMMI